MQCAQHFDASRKADLRAERGASVLRALLLTALVVGGLATCILPPEPDAEHKYSLTVSKDTFKVAVAERKERTVSVMSNGAAVNPRPRLSFVSSDSTVVGIDSSGTAIARRRGKARIRVTLQTAASGDEPPSDSFPVAVVVKSMSVANARATVNSLGDTVPFAPAYLNVNGAGLGTADSAAAAQETNYALRSPGRAVTVNTTSRAIVAFANGTDTVRATVDTSWVDLEVVVDQRADGVAVSPKPITFGAFTEARQLKDSAWDKRGRALLVPVPAVTWRSSDPAVIGLTSSGLATSVRNGSAYLVATVHTKSDSVLANVSQVARRLRIYSGNQQSGAAGSALGSPLVVQMVDSLGSDAAIAGVGIVFHAAAGGGKFAGQDSTIAVTDAAGRASATLTVGATAGLVNTIVARKAGFLDSATFGAGSVVGSVSPASSEITVSTATAASGTGATLTLRAKDAAGNNLTTGGLTVVFTAFGGTSTGTIGPTTDNGDGTYGATFTGVLAGTATSIGATINGAIVTSALPSVAVTPGPLSTATSPVTLSSGTIASGTSGTLRLQAKDAAGNNLGTGGLSVVFLVSGGSSTGTVGSASDNGDGTYTALFTGILAGTGASIGASINGVPVTSTPPVLTVIPGAVSVVQSVVTVSVGNILAGGVSTLTLRARDGAGNYLTAGGLPVLFSFSGGTSTGAIGPTIDSGDGTYTASFTGALAGTPTTIGATISNNAVTSALPTVAVSSGAFSLTTSVVTVSIGSVASGSGITLTLRTKDGAGNNLTAGGLVVAFTFAGGTATGNISAAVDNADGTYTATFTGVAAGMGTAVGATISNNPVTSTLPTVSVIPGPASTVTSIVSVSSGSVASGSGVTVTLRAKDAASNNLTAGGLTVTFASSGGTSTGTIAAAMDNGDGTYTATFTGVLAGTATTVSGAISGVPVTSTLPSVSVFPGPVSLATSTVSVSNGSVASGSAVTLTLRVKDAAGNNLPGGGLTVVLTAAGGASTGVIGLAVDNGDGTYTASFTGALAGSATTIGATVGGNPVVSSLPTVSVTPGPVSVAQSALSVSVNNILAGTTSTLTLTAKDAAGNTLSGGGLTVLFSYAGGSSTGSIGGTTDNGNGTYTATFTGGSAGSATTIAATINSNPVTSTQPTISVAVGLASTATSVVTAPAGGSISSGAGATLTLQTKDAGGNNLTAGGLTVVFGYSGGTSTGTIGSTADNGNGTYTATFTGVIAGTATTIGATIDGAPVSSTLPTLAVLPGLAATVEVVPNGKDLSGGTEAFAADVHDAAGNVVNRSLSWASLNTNVVTINNSTGVATPVASGQATVSATIDGVTGYGLLTVTVPAATPVNIWVPMTSGTVDPLIGVWGTSSSNVFAVGSSSILRFNGSLWAAMTGPAGNWTSVWGSSSSDVFVVGYQGAIAHWNGSSWTTMNSGTSEILTSVWGTSPRDVFAVGYNGVILHYNGVAWSPMSSGTSESLAVVWGTSPTDVHVGSYQQILHYNGSGWTASLTLTGGAPQNFQGIWGASESVAFASGSSQVHHYDGNNWLQESFPTPPLISSALWGSSATDLYMVGQAGGIRRYNGSTWSVVASATPYTLHDIWGTSGANVYAVGENGTILRGIRDGTVTVTPANPTITGATAQLTGTARDAGSNVINGVAFAWTSSDENVATVDPATGLVTVVAGGNATITATAPGGAAGATQVTVAAVASIVVSPSGASVSGVGTTQAFTAEVRDASNNLLVRPITWSSLNSSVATINSSSGVATAVASGQVTVSASSGGTTGYALLTISDPSLAPVSVWAATSSGLSEQIWGMWGVSASDVHAVGTSTTALRFNGTSWASLSTGVFSYSVWGSGASNVYAVGQGGAIVRFDGTSWSPVASGTTTGLARVWGASPRDIFAVGDNGTILHFDGTAWTAMTSGTTAHLTGVWGTSAIDVFAVGQLGTILRYDGANWTPMTSPSNLWLYGVWGTSASNVFAVGINGVVHRFNGSTWTTMSTSLTPLTHSVWGTSPSDVYTVGDNGVIRRFNGTSWSDQSSGVTGNMRALWGLGGEVFTSAGSSGTVLRGYRGGTVSVTPANPIITGATEQLTATARDAGNSVISSVTFSWFSDNTNVATVDPVTGLVTVVTNGSATITATAPGGAAGSTLVTVPAVASVAVSPSGESSSGVGSTKTFTAVARDASNNVLSGRPVTWASLNTSVATIGSSTGIATAVASGQVTVSATAEGVTGHGLLTVTIPGATPVNLFGSNGSPVGVLRGAWGTSASDVFAVGEVLGGGQILRFNGTSWVTVSQPDDGMLDVWGTSTSDVFAVGIHSLTEASVMHFNGSTWSAMTVPASRELIGVWGSSPRDVFAVGAAGSILHYNGTEWSTMSNPVAGGIITLWDVWGSGPTDVYAVGDQETVLHYNGTAWSAFTGPAPSAGVVLSIWGASTNPTDLFIVTSSGKVFRWGGGSWTQVATSASGLYAIWGSSTSDVYAAGFPGTVLHFNGTVWTTLNSGFSGNQWAVWGTSGGDVYVFNNIRRGVRGGTVSITPATPTLTVPSQTQQMTPDARDAGNAVVSGVVYTWTSSDETVATVDAAGLVTAVGSGTTTITTTASGGSAGSTLVTVTLPVTSVVITPSGPSLSGVGTTQAFTGEARDVAGHVVPGKTLTWASLNTAVATINSSSGLASTVAAGQVTVSASVDGITGYALMTVQVPGPTPANLWATSSIAPNSLNQVWGASGSDVFAVGNSGGFRRFDGTSWNSFSCNTSVTLNGVWGFSATDVWGVGETGEIVHYNGSTCSRDPQSGVITTASLNAVWGASPRDVFAAGSGGTILRYDGTSWNSMISNTSNGLFGVWGTSATDVFAVSNNGTIHRYDGTTWSAMTSNTGAGLRGVWGTSSSDMYAARAGSPSGIHRYNGTSWSNFDNTSPALIDIWGTSSSTHGVASDIYAVGSGALLRYTGTQWATVLTLGQLLNGVWGTSASDMWVVGSTGTVMRGYRGTATITVTPPTPTLTTVDETVQLTATAKDALDNVISGVTFTWTSSNTAAATVDANGLVTAVGAVQVLSTTTITATATGGAAVSTTVTVDVPPTGTAPAWTLLSPTGTPPAARSGHAAAYDDINDRMMIFGGYDVSTALNDVWVLENASGSGGTPAWTQLAPTGGPPVVRAHASAVHDAANNTLTVFGGHNTPGTVYYNDVWLLNNANGTGGSPTWTELSPTGSPPIARSSHTALYDATNNRMIIFGGFAPSSNYFSDVWVLSNANGVGGTPAWTSVPASQDVGLFAFPFGRTMHGAVYDATANKMAFFPGSGQSSNPPNDSWVLENANGLGGTAQWRRHYPTGGTPTTGNSYSAVYVAAGQRAVLFGGNRIMTPFDRLSDVWVMTNAVTGGASAAWTQLTPTGSVPVVVLHSAVYNTAGDRMIVFGGQTNSGRTNAVYVLVRPGGY